MDSLIREVDELLRPVVDVIDVEELSKYNVEYRLYGKDKYRLFVENEKRRFIKALDLILKEGALGTLCDLGCFIPFLPVALSRCGFRVKMVYKYSLYGPCFRDSIYRQAESASIEVVDLDIITKISKLLGRTGLSY